MDSVRPRFRAAAIAELIAGSGLSHSAFARRIGVSRSLVAAWLSGVVRPQVSTVCRLCAAFNVPISFFFDSEAGAAESGTPSPEAVLGAAGSRPGGHRP